MPVITDMSQESAVAIQSCATGAPGEIRVETAPHGFVVSQAIYDCWEQIDLDTVTLPNCRGNNPCYQAQCSDQALPDATLTSIAPNTAVVGGPDVTLTVTGTNFTEDSVILWNGSPEPTVFVSPTQLTTVVRPSTASGPSTLPVRVRTEDGFETAPQTFTFTAAAATITSVAPPSTTVGGARSFTLTGTGINSLTSGSYYYTAPGEAETSASYNIVSDTQATLTLPASAVDTAGTITGELRSGLAAWPDVAVPDIVVA